MSHIFGASTADRVVATGTPSNSNLTAFTRVFYIYPTTLTGNRRLWTKGDTVSGTVSRWMLALEATTPSKLQASVSRATTNATATAATGTLTAGAEQVIAMTYSEANGIKLYRGTLGASITEVTYDAAPTAGAGATTAAQGHDVIGNTVASLSAPTLAFQGRISRSLLYNVELTLAQLQAMQFRSPPDTALVSWIEHGFAGTDVHADGSGSANHAYVIGCTVGDHAPINVRGAPTYASPGPAVTIYNNEPTTPSAYTLIVERQWSAKGEGWDNIDHSAGSYRIIPDTTAPTSPLAIGRIIYPAGFGGGSAPATLQRSCNVPRLYVRFWMRLSANWSGHSTGTNKVHHFWSGPAGGINRAFFSAEGAGAAALTPTMRLQGAANDMPDPRAFLNPNLGTAKFIRGQWHEVEIVLVTNTVGYANGEAHWWLDGVKQGEYTDVQFIANVNAQNWAQVQFSPTYGGAGGTVPAEQYMDMDRMYISGETTVPVGIIARALRSIAAVARARFRA